MRRPAGTLQRLPLPLLLALLACGSDAPPGARAGRPPSGAVSSGTPEATRAGLDILARGGNAIDAAVAVSLVLGVTEPSQSGLGGRVVMLIHPAEGAPVLVHVPPPPVPAHGSPPTAHAAVPTALQVLHHAWNRYGSGNLTWEELVEPARRAAEEGYPLGRFRHRTLVRAYERILADSASAALFLAKDRSLPSEQTTLVNPALAATLERVAQEGPEALLGGELGERLIQDLSRRGVALSAAELAAAPGAQETAPLQGSYRGRNVWVAPEPYGGALILAALRFLEQAPPVALEAGGWARTAWVLEALAYARSGGRGSPLDHLRAVPPMPLPVADSLAFTRPGLTPSGGASAVPPGGPARPDTPSAQGALSPRRPPAARRTPPPAPGRDTLAAPTPLRRPGEREETSHFSVVDGDGNAVAVTQTLGAPFGAGASAAGLGFFYSDEALPLAAPLPADTVRHEADSVAGASREAPPSPRGPGEHERTTAPGAAGPVGSLPLAPTIVSSRGRVQLVLGSPGGERGLSAVVQVLVHALDLGEPLDQAVLARRLHVAEGEGEAGPRVYLEGVVWSDSASTSTADALWGQGSRARIGERGFTLGEQDLGPVVQGLDPWFGGVNVVGRSSAGWSAAGDERRDGVGGILVEGSWALEGEPGGVTTSPARAGPPAAGGG